jgi:hypothetical protein
MRTDYESNMVRVRGMVKEINAKKDKNTHPQNNQS